jgi:hypothetical protein
MKESWGAGSLATCAGFIQTAAASLITATPHPPMASDRALPPTFTAVPAEVPADEPIAAVAAAGTQAKSIAKTIPVLI